MSTSIQIPSDFRYVGVAIFSSVLVLAGQGLLVGKYRRRAGIQFPQVYAERDQVEKSRDALLFNCAQRAHQNTLEHIPSIWATTVIVGTQQPILAASACAFWTVGRIFFTIGYLTGDPEKRKSSPIYAASVFGSLGLALAATFYTGRWVWEGISNQL